MSLIPWLKEQSIRIRNRLTRYAQRKPKREEMLYQKSGSGFDQVGRRVDINGRTGVVVDGTVLTITVEWDD